MRSLRVSGALGAVGFCPGRDDADSRVATAELLFSLETFAYRRRASGLANGSSWRVLANAGSFADAGSRVFFGHCNETLAPR